MTRPLRTLLSLGLATMALAATTQQDPPAVMAMKGKAVPAFTMTGLDGKTFSNKDLLGKAYIVDFWATWCGPCKKASPFMQELHQSYGRKGLVVIGANAYEKEGGPQNAAGYQKEHGYSYLFTHSNDELAKAWQVRGIPTFVFVDKNGTVADVFVGYSDASKAKMTAVVEKMLAE
jgi:cytochrome c biogenesis protein CcmG, thiol:disulfide interchange protein DsbE